MKRFYVYILFNQSRTLYVGMTNDLKRRVYEHRNKLVPGFTARYNVTRLARYEAYPTAMAAIEREKQIKGWKRERKIELVESDNPHWEDLGSSLSERFEDVCKVAELDAPGQILRCAQDDGFGR